MTTSYDTMIIGAGTAGLTAAIYTARADKSVLVLEAKGIGGQISSSPLVENYPGFERISGMEFSNHLYEQALSMGAEISLEEAGKIQVGQNGEKIVWSEAGKVKRFCNKLIIATGQTPRSLGLENEEQLVGRGISYCAVCDGAFFKNKTVAVVGGGSAALQSAKLLSGICQNLYIVHRRDQFRGEQRLVEQLKKTENIQWVLDSNIEKLLGQETLTGITVRNKKTGEGSNLPVDGLFVSIGHIPNNEMFGDIVRLDENGYILAAEDCKTNIDGIYAAGDCRTKEVRQLTTAAADGTVCALAD